MMQAEDFYKTLCNYKTMLRNRVIPALTIKGRRLIKTKRFREYKYLGDPLNAVRIFNEKQADELIVVDLSAGGVEQVGINFPLIEKIAARCRMPFTYGGGISSEQDAMRLIELGVEKVLLGKHGINNHHLILNSINLLGAQSVSVALDVRKNKFKSGYHLRINGGTVAIKKELEEQVDLLSKLGVGELVVSSIDNDGLGVGFDYDLALTVRSLCDCPVVIKGGAGSLEDFKNLFERVSNVGGGGSRVFSLQGKLDAPLITYPSFDERMKLVATPVKFGDARHS